jgi:hypothetical protein
MILEYKASALYSSSTDFLCGYSHLTPLGLKIHHTEGVKHDNPKSEGLDSKSEGLDSNKSHPNLKDSRLKFFEEKL